RQITKGIRGLGYEIHGKRGYPKDTLACHIIGYTNFDDEGVEGVEYQYNDYLSQAEAKPDPPQNSTEVPSQGGYPTVETDGTKPLVDPSEPSPDAPEYGHTIVLTIDEYIQYIAQKELMAACEELQAPAGSAIVMHSKSGEILAMANYPNYNLNHYSQSEELSKRNLAIWMQYEPGSVFKIVSASAVLNEKLMTPDSREYCGGGAYRLPNGHVIHDVKPNGWLTLTGIIQKSSNIGIVKVATHLGKERLEEYIRRFGFGAKTGIDLPYEQIGSLRGLRYGYSLGQVPFGQGISATPIQMLNAMNVIASGGVLLQPRVVQEILDANGKPLKQCTPKVIRRVISPEVAEEVKKMLVLVTEAGSGRRARVEGYKVAGKTGTAQKAEKGKGYVKGKVITTFVGFLPADDPQVSIIVVLDEPAGAPLSGRVAAPLFQKIADQTMRYLTQKDLFVQRPTGN
ncbi:penicillin-binding protein 2, partial [Candidatus Poribacteria bacterium]|nr:penicillin-binding protein 2 [Candidatus Poribacteria bacterium]